MSPPNGTSSTAAQTPAQTVRATPDGTTTCDVNEPLISPPVEPMLLGHGTLTGTMRPRVCAAPADDDDWQKSGCQPASLLMVAHWWAATNPHSVGRVQIQSSRHGGLSERALTQGAHGITGASLARDLWGSWSPPIARTPAATGPVVPYKPAQGPATLEGYTTATKWLVHHEITLRSMGNLVHAARPGASADASYGGLPQRMQSHHEPVVHNPIASKRTMIQAQLFHGPLVANMTRPAHNVVIYGYRQGWIYIADSGLVIRDAWVDGHPRAEVQCDGLGHVKLRDDYVFPNKGITWLASVDYLEWFSFPDGVVSQASCT